MSNINSRATVTLNINGQSAQQTLANLRQNALQLETAMANAAAAGDKVELKRLRKELTDTKRQIRDLESSSMQVENVLSNLDKATPRELNKALSTLNRQLEYIQRGTGAWDKQVADIQKVEREIQKVKSEIQSMTMLADRVSIQPHTANINEMERAIQIMQKDMKMVDVGSAEFNKLQERIALVTKSLNEAKLKMETDGTLIKKVLTDINSASPNELNMALDMMNKKLATLEVGSTAWEKQVAEINKVKAALDKAKVSMEMDGKTMQRVLSNLDHASPKELTTVLKILNKDLQNLKVGSSAWDMQTRKIREVKAAIDRVKIATEEDGLLIRRTLSSLNTASPKELELTLKSLTRELENLRRGSSAWTATTEKIKQVKAQLASVRQEIAMQESRWERFNRKLNDWQMSIMGMMAAVSGLIYAGRSAVNRYASMEEEMANTRKYTGMLKTDVDDLNESFKKMDTRTTRDKLNELAQEAGRLGMNTKQSVQEYVEAADIINVALVDLGDGATQTIAKLTNIFGVQQTLGVKESMLSVGSAVNVLSQNCTASKPYLVDFAQRMGGVGAQAKLTIPEILAFGATLDANGQKVEMSASAIGKLTMKLFQDPTTIAKQVGLNVDEFTETLKTSTNEGLMMFLERIHQLGSKDGLAALAPLFGDLGMDGVRMSQVLATLAEHLDMVKWEQEEANKAFNEASSASREYQIFNTTTQADIEKAKKRIGELAVELGGKLLPVMKHVMTSTSAFLRLLNIIVSFITEYKATILTCTAAIAAYTLAVNASNIAFKIHYAWVVAVQAVQKVGAVILATYKSAVLLCSVAYNKMTGNLVKAEVAQRALNMTMKSNVYGVITAGVVLLVAGLVKLVSKMREQSAAQKAMNDIKTEGLRLAQDEINRINTLVAAARNEKLSLEERHKAINALNKIIPGYNGQLDDTTKKYRENTVALKNYIAQLERKYEIEGAQNAIRKASEKIAELRIEEEGAKQELQSAKDAQAEDMKNMRNSDGTPRPQTSGGSVAPSSYHAQIGHSGEVAAAQGKVNSIEKQIKGQQAIIDKVTNVYGTDIQKATVAQQDKIEGDSDGGNSYSTNTGDKSGSDKSGKNDKQDKEKQEDKFKEEKEWKAREEAINKISYAKGEKIYEDYTNRMDEIALQFYDKELKHTDLTEQERIVIQGEKADEQIKQREKYEKKTIEDEEKSYNEQLAIEKQRYIDGKITSEQYDLAVDRIELEHLRTLTKITKEGSKERLDAEKNYRDRQYQDMKKRHDEMQKLEKEHQDALQKIKQEYLGNTREENLVLYNADVSNLDEVYKKMVATIDVSSSKQAAKDKLRIDKAYHEAKLALLRKYNLEELKENQNMLENFNDDLKKFLETDTGQAITQSVDVLVSGMSSVFQQLTSLVQSELEIQEAAIETKYNKEVSLAEGNNYKLNKIEKEKEEATAKVKNEANKKLFAMEVMQAVAQTATAALNAYSSAAAIPVVGWVMAPIAAATALAAGMLQVAAIKKQQQASASQGYSKGGFTPDGDKDQAVGVVHAGEWVASQSLTKNPKTRPLLEALDYAQRTNTIGSITSEQVSKTITAPVLSAQTAVQSASVPRQVVVQNGASDQQTLEQTTILKDYASTMKKLQKRLNEPFVTVNTVTGDTGIKKAQDEYSKLIANKSPKKGR